MGRMKVFFCSFCFDRNSERPAADQSFSQGVDVSHLATPHSSFNLPAALRSSSNSTPVGELTTNGEKPQHQYSQLGLIPTATNPSRATPDSSLVREESPSIQPQYSDNNNQPIPSPHSSSSTSSLYERSSREQQHHHQQNLRSNDGELPQQQQQQQQQPQQHNRDQAINNNGDGTATKLSYDIISVREPLAKILAERQLLHQAQQQQRQLLGDHEYIEVYGDRGSSCFYEEIAGSTASSATYDQIGNASNHNYQALINAYAITNRTNESQLDNNDFTQQEHSRVMNNNNNNHDFAQQENLYDVTHTDQVDNSSLNVLDPIPSTSFNTQENNQKQINQPSSQYSVLKDRSSILSQSIPVYSVINKATRRSNAIIRATVENCRPPQPPPKNHPMSHQSSTSAIQSHQDTSMLMNNPSGSRNSPVSLNSNHKNSKDNVSEPKEGFNHTRLPQPPPRFSKNSTFDATKRPLPLPDNYDLLNNANEHASTREEDRESLNNGYELLNSNFDEDQVDVGYEKIRESHQYSGGSMSSQLCALQLLDNGGYESVQPIYSSPSNALAEPNYEAIGPATASELTAAATARLTAVVAVIDYLKQDQ